MNDDVLAEVEERKKSKVSSIWILPILAAMIGGWLIYNAILEAPIQVSLELDSGEGIESGKTIVRYEGIEIGKVSAVRVQSDMVGVIATLDMDKRAESALREHSQFWVVKPEVSLSGVSGLGTVLSGNYITLRIGEGKPSRSFKALSSPPPKSLNDPGLHLMLKAQDLGSLSIGSPIIYKKITIGDVQSYQLEREGDSVSISIFIQPEFAHLVRENSRFWNASGIEVKGGLTGFDIRTGSITSMLKGGIGLSTFSPDDFSLPVKNGDSFILYDDYAEAEAGEIIVVEFPMSAGVKADVTKVVYRGMVMGQVESVDVNPALTSIKAAISLPPRAIDYLNKNTRVWVRQPKISLSNLSGVADLLSGTQIEIDFDGAEPDLTREFIALDKPPILLKDAPGLHVTLKVDALKSVMRGMDILYRNIPVGSILDYRLSEDGHSIELDAHIYSQYEHLINKSTRFWDAGGIEIDGGLSGVKIRTASLSSILLGGIAFYTPDMRAKPVKNGERFRLFNDYASAHSVGIPITINFDHGEGLKEGTSIKYEGIEVGKVTAVSLNKTLDGVVVKASLDSSASNAANAGTQFWLVKPEIGLARTANLGTLLTGEYITFELGRGRSHYNFKALNEPPQVDKKKQGLNIVLTSNQLSSVKKGVTVSYRGVPVGGVTGYELASSADHVRIFINIEQQYAPLVRANSQFWNASGLDIGFKLFGGAKLKTDSVESILAGGISFATPNEDKMGDIAAEGASFKLYSSRDDEWLEWQPKIPLNLIE